jgi:hypothetical protein
MFLLLIHLNKPLSKLLGVVESNNMASFNKSMKNTILGGIAIFQPAWFGCVPWYKAHDFLITGGGLTTMMTPAYLPWQHLNQPVRISLAQ